MNLSISNRKCRSLFFVVLISVSPSYSQEKTKENNLEIAAGLSHLMYQMYTVIQDSPGAEASITGRIAGPFDWQTGLRIGLDNTGIEGFVRGNISQKFNSWEPYAGLELGLTGRAQFDVKEGLMSETNRAMMKSISPVYMAFHIAPLRFKMNKWSLSFMEVSFGSHLNEPGRTLRLQVGWLTAGRYF
jgi:hypothetical protein